MNTAKQTVIRNTIGSRLRRFVFTLNNYTQKEYEDIIQLKCRWLIVAKEIGEHGTPHLQGACVIGRQVAFSTIKKWPGFARCHVEQMHGTPEDSLRYCSKQDRDAFQSGTIPSPGKRTDLMDVVDKMREGKTVRDLVLEEETKYSTAVIKYYKGLMVLQSLLRQDREHPPVVIWIHGASGIGKTRAAIEFGHELAGPYGVWISSGSLRWFQGYMGQPVALFDDLRTKHAEFSMLLRLLDRYPLEVEIKGASVKWTPRVILVTAPKDPQAMWSLRTDEDKTQLSRRISAVICADDYEGGYKEIFESIRDEYDAFCSVFKIPKMLGDVGNVEELETTEEYIEVKEEPQWNPPRS